MKDINWPDVLARAGKTAVATFIPLVPATELTNGSLDAEIAAGIVAGAAAITVIWNVLLDWTRS
jgi:hypothetical protein